MATLKELKDHLATCSLLGFRLDEETPRHLGLSTRDHGSVGDEEPGEQDIRNARSLRDVIKERFPDGFRYEIDTVDEWTWLNIIAE
jgi:hypothetical protein